MGKVCNTERGEWEELGCAMGFLQRDTHIAGLTEADRCKLIGHSMDRLVMAWL